MSLRLIDVELRCGAPRRLRSCPTPPPAPPNTGAALGASVGAGEGLVTVGVHFSWPPFLAAIGGHFGGVFGRVEAYMP